MNKRTRFNITLFDLIQNEMIKIGDTILHEFKKGENKGTRVEGRIHENGNILLDNGKIYGSLSSAARVYTKHQKNGWIWWSYETESGKIVRLNTLRSEYIHDNQI